MQMKKEEEQHQQQQQTFIQGQLKISLNKLKSNFTYSQIQQLKKKIYRINNYYTENQLSYVLLKLVKSVTEFKIPKINNFQTLFVQDLHSYIIDDIYNFDSFAHIRFTNLTILNLANQTINSLQSLEFVYAPKLRCLELYNNKITNINALAKANFQKLEVITFYHNPITQIEKLYRFHSKKLTGYEFDNKSIYQNRVEDCIFLFKMQNPVPKMIKIMDGQRIRINNKRFFRILNQPGTKIMTESPRRGGLQYLRNIRFD